MKKERFKRQNSSKIRKVDSSWRKPRGTDSKMRKDKKGRPSLVKIGYRKPKSVRNVHPSGFREVLIDSPQEVEKVSSESEAIRISSAVGKRKRIQIIREAEESGIKILNAKRGDKIGSGDTEETGD